MQVSSVTMSQPSLRTAAALCLPLGIKPSLKEDMGIFLFGFLMVKAFGLRFSAFWAFGFLVSEAFGKEKDCRREKNC
jgi:hypothetical protein